MVALGYDSTIGGTQGGKYDKLPEWLKQHGRFCVWRYETLPDRTKPTKVPRNPRTGGGAQSNNPDTFTDYKTACEVADRGGYDGIGVGVFDGLSGVDIDHCITADGELTPLGREVMETMDTYTEISPSGTGLRLFFSTPQGFSYDNDVYYINNRHAGDRANEKHPGAGYGGEGLEIYIAGMTEKFMTVTGRAINSRGIEPRADRLQPILDKFMRKPKKTTADTPRNAAPSTPNNIEDAELIAMAMRARNGSQFERLWNGDTSDYASADNSGHSEADLALCNLLAFWTGRDAQRMDSLFRQSGLMRPKWDSKRGGGTYGSDTIMKAIEGCSEVFTPRTDTPPTSSSVDTEETPTDTPPTSSSVDNDGADSAQDDTAQETGEADKGGTHDSGESDGLQDPAKIVADIYACEGYEEPTPTGFTQLDVVTNGGLRSGLTILGAVSSAGKTTLCVQIADHIAANGRPVLFVSCEQTARELVSKSLSRLMAQRGYKSVPAWAMNSPHERGIWQERKTAALVEACQEYTDKIAVNLMYLSSTQQPTVKDIETKARSIRAKRGVSPLIVIDYLQLLAPRDERDTDKRAADYNVSQLRRIAGEIHAPIVAISSLNRTSYSGSIEMESYKESGGIEYAADLLLGLQPYNMESRMSGVKGEDARKKRAKDVTNEFRRKAVRECEIVVLKNRNGALPPNPLPVTFDCASSIFYDGLEVAEQDPGEWL